MSDACRVTEPREQRAKAELAEVSALSQAELQVDESLARAVVAARNAGATWKMVAEAAGLSLNVAWARWRVVEGSPAARRTGHVRARPVGGKAADGAPVVGLTEAAVRAVLDGLGETYEVSTTLDGDVIFDVKRRGVTVSCSGARVTVDGRRRNK